MGREGRGGREGMKRRSVTSGVNNESSCVGTMVSNPRFKAATYTNKPVKHGRQAI